MWGTLGAALKPVLAGTSAIIPPFAKYHAQPVMLPKAVAPLPESSKEDMDAKLAELASNKSKWVSTGNTQRVQLLEACMWNMVNKADKLAEVAAQSKGTYGQGLGEEMSGAWPVVMALKEYCMSLKAGGQARPQAVFTPQGLQDQLVAEVFPWGMMGALLPGMSAQVWMAPGKPASQGQLYRDKAAGKQEERAGGVALVLGAGNQWTVPLLDILHKLVAEDEVVICKMSPVNEAVGPVFQEVLQPLMEYGVLSFAYGGREVGEYLCAHPKVDSIHLTGSADTCNAIVWGSKDAPRTGKPKNHKRITAELGNITPYVVVPGDWSDGDIRRQVQGLVSGMVHNAGHNCIAAEVVVTAADWPQRDKFLQELRKQLSECPRRVAYYPGSQAKMQAFRQAMSGHKVCELGSCSGEAAERVTCPWLLAEGLTPDQVRGQAENWCGVLQEVALPGLGAAGQPPAAFLQAASQFVNKQLWGSLGISVIAHPRTMKQDVEAWNKFIAGLRYGSVTVNCPCVMGYCVTALPWGAAPGNTLQNVESGIGWVHNTFLFDHVAKGVLVAPWRPAPKPLYLGDNYAVPHILPQLLRFVASIDNPVVAMLHMTRLAVGAVRA